MAFYPVNTSSAIIAIDLNTPDVTGIQNLQGQDLIVAITKKPRLCIGFYNWGPGNQITMWDVANDIEYHTMPYWRPQNWSQGFANMITLENNNTQVNFHCIASDGIAYGMVFY